MRRVALSVALAAAVSVLASAAGATEFTFAFSSPLSNNSGNSSASGMISATMQSDGSYLITGVTGQWRNQTITGIAPLGTEGADNLLFPTSNPLLDQNGFSFEVNGRGDDFSGDVNIYYSGYTDSRANSGYTDNAGDDGLNGTFSITRVTTVSAAPEPGAWALMLGGVGMLGAFLRIQQARRREDAVTDIATA